MINFSYGNKTLTEKKGDIMLNFIICDDHKVIRENVVKVIHEVMMRNKIGYNTHVFDDYNKDFIKVMKSKMTSKIYILDIEVPSGSGIDIARLIRQRDIDSVIIFLTSHDELGYTILKSQFMSLTFISKFDNYIGNLKSALKKAIKIAGSKQAIRFKDQGILYTIPLSDILYITRDSVERKCIIKTDYNTFKINKQLNEINDNLNNSFIQSHRACIVNIERIVSVDSRKRIITFDNGESIDLLSLNYRKELLNKL